MAEYFPLLERAVSALTEPTVEARRSIYERARGALIGQLRRMEPAVPEEDIARESTALDEAIARVEAKFAEAAAPASPATPIPMPAQPSTVAPPAGTAPPVMPPPSRERPMVGRRASSSVDRPPAAVAADTTAPATRVPPRSAAGAPTPVRPAPPPRGTRPVMALRPVSAGPAAQQLATPPAGAEAREATGLPPAGRLATDSIVRSDLAEAPAEAEAPRDGSGFAAALDEASTVDRPDGIPGSRNREPTLRPPAPRPRQDRRFGWRARAVALVAILLMAGIGIAAYRLRDRPEQVVATHSEAATAAGTPGKTVDRAGATGTESIGSTAEPTSGATVPAPVGQDGSDAGPAAPSIAVAQRAALLVDAPEDPQRVRTYVGTVVWHLDSVSPGQGQPLATAVKADVDIPDAKLKVTMLMQRNPEPQLPASHTIEFHFLPQPGNTLGAIKQVNVPEMRKDDDAATGDPLTGVPVAITDNYFLVGLSRGGAEGQNTRLITERNWFDMSLLFVSGKLGKLTFEKGAAGQRTFEDALKAWK